MEFPTQPLVGVKLVIVGTSAAALGKLIADIANLKLSGFGVIVDVVASSPVTFEAGIVRFAT